MDCKTPILGHSALRCAGLSRSQARLQAIPATIYLLGGLAIVAIWLKFAIEKRVFAFRQVIFLSLTGVLGFAVVVASVGLRLDGAGSVGLGGMSSLVCIAQVLAIYYFLPSRYTLPRILDSSLAALSTSSIILNILASIHQGRLLPSSDSNNIVYAECTCLICFYLLCIGTSQFPRYFILIREDSIERQQRGCEVVMKIIPSVTFILAMAFFLTQACLGFTLYPTFAVVMSASMASAVGYSLLIATFFIQNWSKGIPYSHNFQHGFDGIETSEKAREGGVDEEHMRPQGQDVTMRDTHHLAAPPILKVPSHHRVRSPSTIIRSEAGSVVWAGNVTPNPEAGGNPKTANLNGGAQNSAQSRASWDRIQYLMKRDRRTRCPSGITDYGTETSYYEGGGGRAQQQRTSMLSTIAMAVGGYGNATVPPVPPISVHYLTNQNQSDATLSHHVEPVHIRDLTSDKMTARDFAAPAFPLESTAPSNGVLPLQYQSSKLFPAVEWETGDTIIRGSDTASPVASDMKHSRSSSYSVGQSFPSLTSLGGNRQTESDNKHGIGHRSPLATFPHKQIRRASVQGARAHDPADSIRMPLRN